MKKKTEDVFLGLLAVFGGIVLVGGIAILAGLYYAWILMLLIGVLHHNFFPELYPFGYWLCFWPAVLIRIMFTSTNTSNTSK